MSSNYAFRDERYYNLESQDTCKVELRTSVVRGRLAQLSRLPHKRNEFVLLTNALSDAGYFVRIGDQKIKRYPQTISISKELYDRCFGRQQCTSAASQITRATASLQPTVTERVSALV